jgi:hypothetical protein
MTLFQHGDRVRYATTGEDGFPLVRYGWVGGDSLDDGPVMVLLDGELGGDVVDLDKLEPVHICSVTLTLDGTDLLDDPSLRQGLVNLWRAEAETAGLQIASLHSIGTGIRDSLDGFALAELNSGGDRYVLRAIKCPHQPNAVMVHADRPHRREMS